MIWKMTSLPFEEKRDLDKSSLIHEPFFSSTLGISRNTECHLERKKGSDRFHLLANSSRRFHRVCREDTSLSLSFFLCLSISLSPFAATATPFGSRRDISSNSLLGWCILEKIRRMPFCWAYELPFFEFSSISAEYLFTHEEHLQHYYQIYSEIEVFKRLCFWWMKCVYIEESCLRQWGV